MNQWPLKVLQRKYKALLKRTLQLADEGVQAKAAAIRLQRERNALADRVLRLEHAIDADADAPPPPPSESSAAALPELSLADELRPLRVLRQYVAAAAHDDLAHGQTSLPANASANSAAAAADGAAVSASAASGAAAADGDLDHHHDTANGHGHGGDDDDDDEHVPRRGGGGGGGGGAGSSAYGDGGDGSAPKKRKRKAEPTHEPVICVYAPDGRPCKSRAQIGSKYCYHHQPMDPNSIYAACEFAGKKKCNLPVRKDAPAPRLCKRHQPPTAAALAAAATASTADTLAAFDSMN